MQELCLKRFLTGFCDLIRYRSYLIFATVSSQRDMLKLVKREIKTDSAPFHLIIVSCAD